MLFSFSLTVGRLHESQAFTVVYTFYEWLDMMWQIHLTIISIKRKWNTVHPKNRPQGSKSRENKRELMTEPWGTPCGRGALQDKKLSLRTLKPVQGSNLHTHTVNRILWSTESNAADTSKSSRNTHFPESVYLSIIWHLQECWFSRELWTWTGTARWFQFLLGILTTGRGQPPLRFLT